MKYLSLFTGIGGFELGIQQAYDDISNGERNKQGGVEEQKCGTMPKQKPMATQPLCIGYSEIDKYAIQIYEKHFNHKNYGDITKINAEELPDFDFLVGGFPCQAFSIAGKRKGFEDTRGTLFFDIARILRTKRPRLFLLENVKGLLSHDNGNTFRTIISALTELGYDLQWQVLNSKNFGVAQNRERVLIVGHLRGTSRPEVFPIRRTTGNAIEVVGDLSSETWKKRNESTRRVYGLDGVAPTIPTAQGGGVMAKIAIPVLTPDRLVKRQNGRRFKEDGEPSFTLTGQDKHGVYDGADIRRFTPKECERLQGFPDDWTNFVSDSQRYKTLGNAVTVNVIKEIMLKLLCS